MARLYRKHARRYVFLSSAHARADASRSMTRVRVFLRMLELQGICYVIYHRNSVGPFFFYSMPTKSLSMIKHIYSMVLFDIIPI